MKHTAGSEIPQHRKVDLTWSSEAEARQIMLAADFCGYCRKLLLPTESAARSYIGLLLRTDAPRPLRFTLRPYRCPHHAKGWHIGRDRKTAQLLKEAKAR